MAQIKVSDLKEHTDALSKIVDDALNSKDEVASISFRDIRKCAKGILGVVGDDTAEETGEDEDATAASNSLTKVAALSMDEKLRFAEVISGRAPVRRVF
jgi:hypothetical protein